MNGKKNKMNTSPKNAKYNKNCKKISITLQSEIKKKLYKNDLRTIDPSKKHNKSREKKILTDITIKNTNDNKIRNNNLSQILKKYIEEVPKKSNNKRSTHNTSEEQMASDYYHQVNYNDKEIIDISEKSKNYSDFKNVAPVKCEKGRTHIISNLFKLRGIKTDKINNNKNYKKSNNINKDLNNSDKINYNRLIINNINNKRYSKNNNIKNSIKKNFTSEAINVKENLTMQSINDLKGKNKDINKDCKIINKTINSNKGNSIREITINLTENDSYSNISKNNKSKLNQKKSFIKQILKNNYIDLIDNHKNSISNVKSINRNIIKTLFTNKKLNYIINKNIKLNLEKDKSDNIKFYTKENTKIFFPEKKIENENNKKYKRNNESKNKIKSKEKKEHKIKINSSKLFTNNNKNINNYNNNKKFDYKKLKRVQIQNFSIIDEIKPNSKNINVNNNKKINNKEYNKKTNKKNNFNKKLKEKKLSYNNIEKHNPKISNDTISNDMWIYNQKNNLNSFLSSSTINNDLVNYKLSEKNASYLLNNNNNKNKLNVSMSKLSNLNFSIINNSNINNEYNNQNNDIINKSYNNASKNDKNSEVSICDIIHLSKEKEQKLNFLIENNSKTVNHLESNIISDISSVENRKEILDYKINIYESSKVKNNIKNNKDMSSNDDNGESIINQFDIIENQKQNESKEIKLSQIKNKEVLNDNTNPNIFVSNLSKLTNFVDSKFGNIKNNKINDSNSDLKKKKLIQESQNSNNIEKNDTNSKTQKKNKEIDSIKTQDKNNKNDYINNDISKDFDNSFETILIDNDAHDNYFFIKNIEKNQKKTNQNIENDKSKLKFKNIRNIIYINKNLKEKFVSANISNKRFIICKKDIFEDEDINPTNKLLYTNKKDILNINDNNKSKILIGNNDVKRIKIEKKLNNSFLNDKKLLCPPSSIKFKIKLEEEILKNNINIHNEQNPIPNKSTIFYHNENDHKNKSIRINEMKCLNNEKDNNNIKKNNNSVLNLSNSNQLPKNRYEIPLINNIFNINRNQQK